MAANPPWGLIDIEPILALTGPGDPAIAGVSSAQHGLITSPQLAFAGISRRMISRRVATARLHPVHRGVFLVGHRATEAISILAAAVLACGEGTLLSHRSAAVLWGLLLLDEGSPVHVSVPAVGRKHRARIRVHAATMDRRDRTRRELVPVTSPGRTLLDVAETEGSLVAEHALNEARSKRIITRNQLAALYRRTPGRRGWGPLLPLLREDRTDDFSRQEAEKTLYRLIRKAELPRPRRNVRVHGVELDFYWPELQLNVELDGYRWHSARHSLNNDRDRDTFLAARGIQVVRFSRDQLAYRPEVVVARLAAALALASAA